MDSTSAQFSQGHDIMSDGERRWWVCEDVEFIGSEIGDDSEVGFLEFADGVMLVCSAQGESSIDGASTGMSNESEAGAHSLSYTLADLDDIPF